MEGYVLSTFHSFLSYFVPIIAHTLPYSKLAMHLLRHFCLCSSILRCNALSLRQYRGPVPTFRRSFFPLTVETRRCNAAAVSRASRYLVYRGTHVSASCGSVNLGIVVERSFCIKAVRFFRLSFPFLPPNKHSSSSTDNGKVAFFHHRLCVDEKVACSLRPPCFAAIAQGKGAFLPLLSSLLSLTRLPPSLQAQLALHRLTIAASSKASFLSSPVSSPRRTLSFLFPSPQV